MYRYTPACIYIPMCAHVQDAWFPHTPVPTSPAHECLFRCKSISFSTSHNHTIIKTNQTGKERANVSSHSSHLLFHLVSPSRSRMAPSSSSPELVLFSYTPPAGSFSHCCCLRGILAVLLLLSLKLPVCLSMCVTVHLPTLRRTNVRTLYPSVCTSCYLRFVFLPPPERHRFCGY